MNENEMAAIAAGLWDPLQERAPDSFITAEKQRELKEKFRVYITAEAPDMHEPANLWRALENLEDANGGAPFQIVRDGNEYICFMAEEPFGRGDSAIDAMFAGLVTRYRASGRT